MASASPRADFSRTDPETTRHNVRYLARVAIRLNAEELRRQGGRISGERQPGLVEQAVAAALQTFAGFDPYPDPFAKAAMLLRGIAGGHPFRAGNKRTGVLVAGYYLEQMGYQLCAEVTPEQIVALALGVAEGRVEDIDDIAAELRQLFGRRPHARTSRPVVRRIRRSRS